MPNRDEDSQFSEWFCDPYIEDDGFSEQLYLSLDKLTEKRNRISRIVSLIVMISSMAIGLVYILLEGIPSIDGFDSIAFVGIALLTTILSMEPET